MTLIDRLSAATGPDRASPKRVCAICGKAGHEATYGFRKQLAMLGYINNEDKAHPSCVRKLQAALRARGVEG